jgi:hypothetical protein
VGGDGWSSRFGAEIESINRQIDLFDLAPPHLSLHR